MRGSLSKGWQAVSRIHFEWFEPATAEDFFTWRVRSGANRSLSPNHTQSWSQLTREAQDMTKPVELLSEHIELIRFFLLACPHRANAVSLGLLDT